jgi:hypothetical protein
LLTSGRERTTVRPGYGGVFWVKFGNVEPALRGFSGAGTGRDVAV